MYFSRIFFSHENHPFPQCPQSTILPYSRKWHHHPPRYYVQNRTVITDWFLSFMSSLPVRCSQLRPQTTTSRSRHKPSLLCPVWTPALQNASAWWMTNGHCSMTLSCGVVDDRNTLHAFILPSSSYTISSVFCFLYSIPFHFYTLPIPSFITLYSVFLFTFHSMHFYSFPVLLTL